MFWSIGYCVVHIYTMTLCRCSAISCQRWSTVTNLHWAETRVAIRRELHNSDVLTHRIERKSCPLSSQTVGRKGLKVRCRWQRGRQCHWRTGVQLSHKIQRSSEADETVEMNRVIITISRFISCRRQSVDGWSIGNWLLTLAIETESCVDRTLNERWVND